MLKITAITPSPIGLDEGYAGEIMRARESILDVCLYPERCLDFSDSTSKPADYLNGYRWANKQPEIFDTTFFDNMLLDLRRDMRIPLIAQVGSVYDLQKNFRNAAYLRGLGRMLPDPIEWGRSYSAVINSCRTANQLDFLAQNGTLGEVALFSQMAYPTNEFTNDTLRTAIPFYSKVARLTEYISSAKTDPIDLLSVLSCTRLLFPDVYAQLQPSIDWVSYSNYLTAAQQNQDFENADVLGIVSVLFHAPILLADSAIIDGRGYLNLEWGKTELRVNPEGVPLIEF